MSDLFVPASLNYFWGYAVSSDFLARQSEIVHLQQMLWVMTHWVLLCVSTVIN
jgi:hypothetical protein